MGILGTGSHIGGATPAPPLGNRLGIDPVPLGQRPQALLTILYCSTDCRCRAGAPVKNLTHRASFHFCMDNAPSNFGTKHLARIYRSATKLAAAGFLKALIRTAHYRIHTLLSDNGVQFVQSERGKNRNRTVEAACPDLS